VGFFVCWPALLTGQILQTFPPTFSPTSYPSNWWTLTISAVLYGAGASGCFYIVMLYVLYWLQILEVKRAAFESKMKEQGKEVAKLDEQKKERFGKIVLEMSKAKNIYASRALVGTFTSGLMVIITQLTLAFNLDSEDKLSSSSLRYGIAVTYLSPALVAAAPAYTIGTLGRAAVYLYNKKSVTMQYMVLYPLIVMVVLVYFLLAVGRARPCFTVPGVWAVTHPPEIPQNEELAEGES
ncbi:hypothetical protein TrLO_g15363, partial [Triparma laevis f. longispina]